MGAIQQQTGKAFENKVLDALKRNGVFTLKMGTGRQGTVFDILGVKYDRTIAFECKTVQKGDKLKYTNELIKKTDELNRYERINNELYLLVDFKECGIYLSKWYLAHHTFVKCGEIKPFNMMLLSEMYFDVIESKLKI